ncbi:MAG TPA: FtsX-like permease family protein [Burkholderiales bacterium]|nr:FtsX-like permease family protein [Burkholderiales bacterium]
MLNLAWRMLRRDWRAGELRILAVAVVIAVASVTSVGFFADRVRQALVKEAHQLLGGDVVLIADHPWPAGVRDAIAIRGLRVAYSMTLISMARVGERSQLVGVKAVGDAYPLRGKLRSAPGLNVADAEAERGPARGTVWPDERLALALDLKVGDRLELGDATFTVGAVLTLEPDRSTTFFNVAPRLLMHRDDVPATGLLQPGSRVWYYLLAAGERDAARDFEAWVKPRLGRGESLQSLENARPEIRAGLERAQKFIGLTALLAVILAAVAVSLATRRYTRRHLDGYAVMRCLGATQRQLVRLFAWEFAALGVLAAALGCLAGYAAQFVIALFVSDLMLVRLPQPTLVPAVQGFLTGLALLLGFALPPLLQLKSVPALRVIRRDVGAPRQSALAAYGIGAAAVGALLVWQAGDAKLGLIVLGGFATGLAAFGVVSFAALHALAGLSGAVGPSWRYGLASLRRRAKTNTVQIMALSLGLTAILLLTFTRGDLLATWRAKTPPDAPNRFIVNIQPDQRAPLEKLFAENGVAAPTTYPMVRGRYVALNGAPVDVESYQDRERRLVEREFNLSFMAERPAHNAVIGGSWFGRAELERGALSVEEGIAKSLGWKLGDTLTWQVAGRSFSAPITSLRKLDWDSMRVNFFVIATPQLLDGFPASYVTSFHLPAAQAAFVNRLSQRFPNMTVIDTSAILRQIQSMADKVIHAVQFVFLFALGAGVLVLYAALLATQDERVQEAAVMRALGASRAQVLAAQRAEFVALGLLAGLLAAVGATAIGYVIATRGLEFEYHVNHWVWLAGPALGLACVALNAWAGARAALRRPPILALREA